MSPRFHTHLSGVPSSRGSTLPSSLVVLPLVSSTLVTRSVCCDGYFGVEKVALRLSKLYSQRHSRTVVDMSQAGRISAALYTAIGTQTSTAAGCAQRQHPLRALADLFPQLSVS